MIAKSASMSGFPIQNLIDLFLQLEPQARPRSVNRGSPGCLTSCLPDPGQVHNLSPSPSQAPPKAATLQPGYNTTGYSNNLHNLNQLGETSNGYVKTNPDRLLEDLSLGGILPLPTQLTTFEDKTPSLERDRLPRFSSRSRCSGLSRRNRQSSPGARSR